MLTTEAGTLLPKVFKFTDKSIRVELIESQPWFIAKDVCSVLNIKRPSNVIRYLEADEKGVSKVSTPGGTQVLSIVNESGLYNLIFRSNKPEAKRFRRWVTNDVLPALRKTGQYSVNRVKGLPALSAPNHNRLTSERIIDILSDVCLIDQKDLRERLVSKLIAKGGM